MATPGGNQGAASRRQAAAASRQTVSDDQSRFRRTHGGGERPERAGGDGWGQRDRRGGGGGGARGDGAQRGRDFKQTWHGSPAAKDQQGHGSTSPTHSPRGGDRDFKGTGKSDKPPNRLTPRGARLYDPYMKLDEIDKLIKAGSLHEGIIKFSPQNRKEAFATVEGLLMDVLIVGLDQNRAFEGDKVAIQLYPHKKWPRIKPVDDLVHNEAEEEKARQAQAEARKGRKFIALEALVAATNSARRQDESFRKYLADMKARSPNPLMDMRRTNPEMRSSPSSPDLARSRPEREAPSELARSTEAVRSTPAPAALAPSAPTLAVPAPAAGADAATKLKGSHGSEDSSTDSTDTPPPPSPRQLGEKKLDRATSPGRMRMPSLDMAAVAAKTASTQTAQPVGTLKHGPGFVYDDASPPLSPGRELLYEGIEARQDRFKRPTGYVVGIIEPNHLKLTFTGRMCGNPAGNRQAREAAGQRRGAGVQGSRRSQDERPHPVDRSALFIPADPRHPNFIVPIEVLPADWVSNYDKYKGAEFTVKVDNWNENISFPHGTVVSFTLPAPAAQ